MPPIIFFPLHWNPVVQPEQAPPPTVSYSLETEAGGSFVTVTNEELETALGGRGGTVSRRWLFEWRDVQYNLLGDPIRDGVLPGGSLKYTVDADVPVTGTITVIPAGLPFSLSSGTNHLSITLLLALGGQFLRLPQALMRVDSGDEEVLENAQSSAAVVLSDLSSYLLDKTPVPVTIPAGSNVVEGLRGVLDGIGLQHDFEDSTDITPVIISVGPDTPRRTIVDRLCAVANYYPVAPDPTGVFRTERQIIPKAASDQTYGPEEPTLFFPPLRRRPDRTGQYKNRAVVLFDHPDRDPGYVDVVNNDPDSNISIPRKNETITQKLDNGGYVLNPDRAEEYAIWYLRHQHAQANKAEIITVFDPRQVLHRQYTLSIPGIEDDTEWELLGWNIDLTATGTMTHQIGRSLEVQTTTLVKPAA